MTHPLIFVSGATLAVWRIGVKKGLLQKPPAAMPDFIRPEASVLAEECSWNWGGSLGAATKTFRKDGFCVVLAK